MDHDYDGSYLRIYGSNHIFKGTSESIQGKPLLTTVDLSNTRLPGKSERNWLPPLNLFESLIQVFLSGIKFFFKLNSYLSLEYIKMYLRIITRFKNKCKMQGRGRPMLELGPQIF
jgi:hypothetical protein